MLLEEGERQMVSGAAGRIWSPSGEYAQFETAREYTEYRRPGTATSDQADDGDGPHSSTGRERSVSGGRANDTTRPRRRKRTR